MGGINFDIAAIIVFSFNLYLFVSRRRLRILQSTLYSILLVISLGSAIMDAAGVLLYEYQSGVPLPVHYAVNVLYYIFQNSVAPAFCVFLLVVAHRYQRLGTGFRILLALPWACAMGIILSTPWTHAAFYFDEALQYRRNIGLTVLYGVSALYAIISLIALARSRKTFSARTALGLVLFSPITLSAFIFQFFHPDVLIVNFAISVSELIILFSINDFDSFVDGQTGLFNRAALAAQLENIEQQKLRYAVFLVYIDNKEFLEYAVRPEMVSSLEQALVNRLFSESGKHRFLARLDFGEYVLMIPDPGADAVADVQERILERVRLPLGFAGKRYTLHARLAQLTIPDDASRAKVVFQAHRTLSLSHWDYPLDSWLSLPDLSLAERHLAIVEAIKEALDTGALMVYFQPIINAKTGALIAAEALVRLKNAELGFIPPDEFIPIAEKNGLIHAIGDYVLDCSCAFFASLRKAGIPLQFMEINLSPVQFAQFNLTERFYATALRHGLSPGDLCFEITETAAAQSPLALRRTTDALNGRGFALAIDDFGIGNSNIATLIEIPFSVVKLDRSLITEASARKPEGIELKGFVDIFRRLGVSIVAEGVETEEQIHLLADLGVHLIQGYYFSRPLPPEDFLQFCKRAKA